MQTTLETSFFDMQFTDIDKDIKIFCSKVALANYSVSGNLINEE